MRLIDIYKEEDGAVSLVTCGCIQSGEPPELTRTPGNKFYEMADGTCACYPSATAKACLTLELECTRAQADAIDAAAHSGSLLFAGILFGARQPEGRLPYRTGYRAFLAGDISIRQKYALSAVYAATLPLRLDVSGESFRTVTVPAICPTGITIEGASETFSGFDFRLVGGYPVFVRRRTVFTYGSTLTFTVQFFRADNPDTPVTDATAYIMNSALPQSGYVQVVGEGSLTETVNLASGFQTLDVRIIRNGLHALRLRLPVHRQAVGA